MFDEELEKYFRENIIPITLNPSDKQKTFSEISELFSYYTNEENYWANTGQYHAETNSFYSRISAHKKEFERYTNTNDIKSAKKNLDLIIEDSNSKPNTIIDSNTPLGKILKDFYESTSSDQKGDAFYAMYTQKSFRNVNFNTFEGAIAGYLYNHHFSDLNKAYDDICADIDYLEKDYTTKFNDLHTNAEEELRNHTEEISSQQKSFTEWQDSFKTNTEEYLETEKNEFEKLHKTYDEYMSISEPTKYWDELAMTYENKGKTWIKLCFLPAGLIVTLVLVLLYCLPENFLNNPEIRLETIIRFSILLALGFSALFYILSLFIKLATSSYHLSRDARERKQLTYVYLALMRRQDVDEKQRSIILQSLFSRSDTGLLKGDSSPTVPTGLIGTILGSNS